MTRKATSRPIGALCMNIPAPPFGNDRRRACRDTPTDTFYPAGRYTEAAIADARDLCRRCPLKQECADWATEHGEPDGVWGNTTPNERRELRRKPAVDVA